MSSPKGLNNVGNTCYLNSGLQMLIQNQDFCKLILDNQNKSENLKVMADFIKEYYTSSQRSVTPSDIKKMVGNKNKIFRGNSQQDSAEFIVYLLDILNDDLKGELNKLFQIKSETIIKCKLKRCLKTSTTIENNNYLILPINSSDETLDDCYRGYKVHEKLEGDDMYYCDACKAKRIASKRLQVVGWSDNLIVWLKRFENNGHRLSKNNKEIEIPFDWRHDYTIKGAVVHMGGIGGGHYIYISRDITTNVWTIYDDSSTSQLRPEQVQKYLNHAYIFNYVKK